MFFNVCLHSRSFPLRPDWRKSDSSVDEEHQRNWKWNYNSKDLGRFPKVRTGRPDHGQTSHFDKAISFFQEFLLKSHLLRAYYLGLLNISGWIVLIKSEILITTEMVWPVSSAKWEAPLVASSPPFSRPAARASREACSQVKLAHF